MDRIAVVVFASALLSSCTLSITARLLNNTSVPITVIVERQDESIERHTLEAGRSVDVKGWILAKRMKIHSGSNTWCYESIVEPPMDFQAFPGWFVWVKRVVRVRLDPGGQIVVLAPTQTEPDPIPEQPKGFPITPSDCRI